jgi:predicted phosphoribosyltransferase
MLSKDLSGRDKIIVGIPRGGLVIAETIANRFPHCEFGVLFVKRLRSPHNSEISVGSLLSNGIIHLNTNLREIPSGYLTKEISIQKVKLAQQISKFGLNEYRLKCQNKTVLLVDDGAYTGCTLLAAIEVIKDMKPKNLIVAVPIINSRAISLISQDVDKIEFIKSPKEAGFIEGYYGDFTQIDDSIVDRIINQRVVKKNQ